MRKLFIILAVFLCVGCDSSSSGGGDDFVATIPTTTRYQYYVCPNYSGSADQCYSVRSITPYSEHAILFLAQHEDFYEFRYPQCPNNNQTNIDIVYGSCGQYDITVEPDGEWINTIDLED